MDEKSFEFVAQAAMLDGNLYDEVKKLRDFIRDVRSAATETADPEELCLPMSGRTASPCDLRQADENTADRADISQSGHKEGNSVKVPRVVA